MASPVSRLLSRRTHKPILPLSGLVLQYVGSSALIRSPFHHLGGDGGACLLGSRANWQHTAAETWPVSEGAQQNDVRKKAEGRHYGQVQKQVHGVVGRPHSDRQRTGQREHRESARGDGDVDDKEDSIVSVEPHSEQKGQLLNSAITAKFVRLVTEEGHRVVSRQEALQYAQQKQLDLVQVDSKTGPPVCKVFDYRKQAYIKGQQVKDRKKQKGNQLRLNEMKELRFSSKTETKDLEMKAQKACKFMEQGYRVKFVATFRGDGIRGQLLDRIMPLVEDIAVIEQGPKTESHQAWVIFRHIKFGPVKKKPPSPQPQPQPQPQEVNEEEEEEEVEVEGEEDGYRFDVVDSDPEEEDEDQLGNSKVYMTNAQSFSNRSHQPGSKIFHSPSRDLRQPHAHVPQGPLRTPPRFSRF